MNSKSHWPYRAAIMYPEAVTKVWWPESSNEENSMVIGGYIPGDKETAELCARCCNIAYEQALEDVVSLLLKRGLDVSKALNELIQLDDICDLLEETEREMIAEKAGVTTGLPYPTPEQAECKHKKWQAERYPSRHCMECGLQMWDAGD